jgi:hypothetical protein
MVSISIRRDSSYASGAAKTTKSSDISFEKSSTICALPPCVPVSPGRDIHHVFLLNIRRKVLYCLLDI